MICKNCKNEMFKDDVDFNFKGNYDNYWLCDNCKTSCIEQFRFGHEFKVIWYEENEK